MTHSIIDFKSKQTNFKWFFLFRKWTQKSDSDDDEDDDDGESDEEAEPSTKRKKPQASNDEESDKNVIPPKKKGKTAEKKKWVKKKAPKKAKPVKAGTFDTGLDLALDEELALHLLGSKSWTTQIFFVCATDRLVTNTFAISLHPPFSRDWFSCILFLALMYKRYTLKKGDRGRWIRTTRRAREAYERFSFPVTIFILLFVVSGSSPRRMVVNSEQMDGFAKLRGIRESRRG